MSNPSELQLKRLRMLIEERPLTKNGSAPDAKAWLRMSTITGPRRVRSWRPLLKANENI